MSRANQLPSFFSNPIVISILIGLFACLLYVNTLNHEFVYDDQNAITKNWVVTGGVKNIKYVFSKPYRYGYLAENSTDFRHYRPIPKLMFLLEWSLSPDNPKLGHIVNIILYGVLSTVLTLFLFLLFGKNRVLLIVGSMLLFVSHPIHTEVVANIKELESILCFMFGILSLFFALEYHKKEKKSINLLIGTSICMLLALLSKEIGICFLGAYIITFLFVHFKNIQKEKKNSLYVVIAFIIPIFYFLYLRNSIVGYSTIDANVLPLDNLLFDDSITVLERFMTATSIAFKYLEQCFYPFNLSCDYSTHTFDILKSPTLLFFISLFTHILLIILGLYWTMKGKVIGWSFLWYVTFVSIISNVIVLVSTIYAERLIFIASLGACVIITILFIYLSNLVFGKIHSNRNKVFSLSFILLLTTIFSFKTIDRNKDWVSNRALFSKDVNTSTKSIRLHNFNAKLLLNDKYKKWEGASKDSIDEKIEHHLSHALVSPTIYAEPYIEMGRHLEINNLIDSAIYCYKKYIEHDSIGIKANAPLAKLYIYQKKYEKAEPLLKEQLNKDPYNIPANATMGKLFSQKKDFQNAFLYYNRATQSSLKKGKLDVLTCSYAAYCALEVGDEKVGSSYLQRALEEDPTSPEALYFTGQYYYSKSMFKEAIHLYNKLLGLDFIENKEFVLKGHLFCAKSYLKLREVKKMKKYIEKAYDLEKTPETMSTYSHYLIETNQLEQGLKLLNEIEKKDIDALSALDHQYKKIALQALTTSR